ncbi:MAG: class I SAM-dependent methyltransferase [Candidatus Omnitrophota bacterium]
MNEDYQKKIFSAHIKKNLPYQGDVTSQILLNIVKKYVGGEILDIGAGSGALVELLRSHNHTVIGIDTCANLPLVSYGSITDLQFDNDFFDTVFCIEVLEHLTDQQIDIGLSEIKRSLKKDRYFILTVPYNEDLSKNIFTCPKCGEEFHKFGHLQSFNKEKIINLLSRHGFTVKAIKVYALGAMAILPFGRYLNFLFKRLKYDFLARSFVVMAQKIKEV